jgi:hypothetical protein
MDQNDEPNRDVPNGVAPEQPEEARYIYGVDTTDKALLNIMDLQSTSAPQRN